MESIGSVMRHYKLKIQKAAKEQGYDIPLVSETPEQREKRKEQEARQAAVGLRKRKVRELYRMSLWSSGVPIKFEFGQWNPKLQPNSALAHDLGKQAYTLAKKLEQASFNVALYGKVGTGKTSLALAIMDDLQKHGQSAVFVSTAELQELYRMSMQMTDAADRLRNTLRAMKEADVLVMDDFGTEGGNTDRSVRLDMQGGIYQVANARLGKTTILTTNNTPQELGMMYDGKIISRLLPKHPEQRLSFDKLKEVRQV